MAHHNQQGKWGEQVACEMLITKGYTIVARDTREGYFEIDIIALKGNRIIFVEVKTLTDGNYDPLRAITPEKIKRMCKAADIYVRRYQLPHEVQFDLIAVTGNADNYKIEHIPDAFRPPLRGYR